MLPVAPANQQSEIGELLAAGIDDIRGQRAATVSLLRQRGWGEGDIARTEFNALAKELKDKFGLGGDAIAAERIAMEAGKRNVAH